MIGSYHVRVENRRSKFDFTIKRNITIVRGDSGTGKTTLYEMISNYTRLQQSSGVQIACDVPCVALLDMDWENQLRNIHNSIVFIDEGSKYVSSYEFANAAKNSSNYYVIFT